jgi:hypothetical protein
LWLHVSAALQPRTFNILALTIVCFTIIVSDVNYIHLYLSQNRMASVKEKKSSELFVKSWKETISFALSVLVSMEQLDCHWADYHEICYLRPFRKSIERIQISLESIKNKRYFTWRPIYILIISRSILLKMRNIWDKSCRENQNTNFEFNNFFFSKIVPFMR